MGVVEGLALFVMHLSLAPGRRVIIVE